MAAEDLLLKFEIVEGRTPNAEAVARALLAWIDVLKAASAAVEPDFPLEVGLVGVEDGSDVFKLLLRRAEAEFGQLKSGMDQYPLVSKAVITLAGLVGATTVTVAVTEALTPDPRIPDDQMAVFEEGNRLLRESNDLQRESQKFYGILQDEPAIERMDVLRPDRSIAYSIPRGEFAERSGLWSGEPAQETGPASETRTDTWDVVLIRPVLVAEHRRWQFVRDGLEFSARMDDEAFLEAIRDKTLSISLAQGIRMRVEVKYKEEFNGENWLPVKGSHKISRVLDPLPPVRPNPLFPSPRSPEE